MPYLNIAQSPFLIWFGDCFVCMFKPKSFIRLLRANERFGFEEVLLSGKTIRSMTHLRGATVSCLQYNVSSVKSSSNYYPTPTKGIYPYIINVLENKLIQSILVACLFSNNYLLAMQQITPSGELVPPCLPVDSQ